MTDIDRELRRAKTLGVQEVAFRIEEPGVIATLHFGSLITWSRGGVSSVDALAKACESYARSCRLSQKDKRGRAVFAHQLDPSSAPNKEART